MLLIAYYDKYITSAGWKIIKKKWDTERRKKIWKYEKERGDMGFQHFILLFFINFWIKIETDREERVEGN